MSAAHIAARLETATGVELNDATVEDCGNGLAVFTAVYTDRTGNEVSFGFAFPPEREAEIVGLIAFSLSDRL